MTEVLRSMVGIVGLLVIAWQLSINRRAVQPRVVFAALAMQLAIGALILFVPAGRPPHKPGGPEASVEDRVAMVGLAITGNPAFELSRIDVDRPGPSYTTDTVALLAAIEAAAGRTPDLTLILSAETLADLPDWREPRELVERCRIAVVPREGHPAPEPAWLAARFPGLEDRFDLLDGPRLGISSTGIRERVAAGRSIRYLVPATVERHIADHHLYTVGEKPA